MTLYFIMPACGEGLRLQPRGIKPFITMTDGVTMLQKVIAQAPLDAEVHLAFKNNTEMTSIDRKCTIHLLDHSIGQAHTIYQVMMRLTGDRKRPFNMDDWLLISNCDNAISRHDVNIMCKMALTGEIASGIVATFTPPNEDDLSWSFCHVNKQLRVMKVTEKVEPTRFAVCGVYLLRARSIERNILETDVHLSQVLRRLMDLRVHKVQGEYTPWNDINQLEAWEERNGPPQTRFQFPAKVRD